MNTDIPLIYTSRGNLPVDSLDYRVRWPFEDGVLWCIEEYMDKQTGEVVRDNRHAYCLKPLPLMGVEQGKVG